MDGRIDLIFLQGKNMKFFYIKLAFILLVISTSTAADIKAVRESLKKSINDYEKSIIQESVIKDLYQVSHGLQIFYVTSDGKYAFTGNLLDLTTGENITALSAAKLRQSLYKKLDVSSMIIYPATGKAKMSLVIFSDIDCPYCRKMHKEIPELNEAGIEVRYLAYPRSGVGGKSYWKAVSAWCAKNPAKAMDDAMLRDNNQDNKCENPVKKHMQLAKTFGVNGTPNIITDKGYLIPGYVPAKELIKKLGL